MDEQQDNIVETKALCRLLNALIIVPINWREVPLSNTLNQIFEYALENGYLESRVCERVMTACETRTLKELREDLLAEGTTKHFFFNIGCRPSSALVRVRLEGEAKQGFDKALDRLFIIESRGLALHGVAARAIVRKLEIDRKTLRGMRVTGERVQQMELARRAREWGAEQLAMRLLFKKKKDLFAVAGRLDQLKDAIGNILFGGAMPTALDVHYLLNRSEEALDKEAAVLREMKEQLFRASEVSWGSVREWLKIATDSLSEWKSSKIELSEASLAHKRKILKLKWREHRIHQAQAALKRRKGQRKQTRLELKRQRVVDSRRDKHAKLMQARIQEKQRLEEERKARAKLEEAAKKK